MAGSEKAVMATSRWLFAGPDDEVSRRIVARLSMEPAGSPGAGGGSACRFVAAGSEASYAAAFTAAGASAAPELEAVVYRPPRRPRSEGKAAPSEPDLADAAAFFAAFARAFAGDAGAAAGVAGAGQRRPPRVVLISSAAAVSPAHHHPGYVEESERPKGENPIALAWLDLEALVAARLGHPEPPGVTAAAGTTGASVAPGASAGSGAPAGPAAAELIVLRPAAVAARDGEDALCRALRGRAAVVAAGFDPSVQLLGPDDMAAAVACALLRGAGKPGIYHVAPAGAVPVRAALRLAGVRRLPLGWLGGDGRLDYLRHSQTVSGRKIERELGFLPQATSAAAIRAELGGAAVGADLGGRPATPGAGQAAPSTGPGGRLAAPPASGGEALEFDPFGMDRGYIDAYGRTLFRFLHNLYWRIEHEGLDNVPRQGRAVLTGVHRGFMPWDGVMALHLVARRLGRYPRFLVHPTLVKFPFLANYLTKLGGIMACRENADWVLGNDELLGMFPEGIQGAFTRYRDAYRLGKFGRDEYVKMALRNRAPLVPFVTVGSAEIYPILAKIQWRGFQRFTEWPCLPICPNFPLPGLPLPSKWHTRFLEPIPVHQTHPPEAADDPAVVKAISREVRARMAAAIAAMLARRKSVFFGSIFAEKATAVEPQGGAAR
jgi:1-acyl-sn-glycerol-3-phosphate acyltransferase/nucleoside-diphosphate-sugar epimerase